MRLLLHLLRASALGLGLTVSGCYSGGSPPLPSPLPPGPVAHPGKELVLAADWGGPLSASGTCGGSPFSCSLSPGTQWGLQQQTDLGFIETSGGRLVFHLDSSGMSMVSPLRLDPASPMSVEETVDLGSLDCNRVPYQGPVIYGGGVDDGDPTGRYRALYISCFPGDHTVRLWLYSPTWAGVMPNSAPVAYGLHSLRIDWFPGERVEYWLDGRLIFTEDESFAHDPLDIPTAPHPAMWFGAAEGDVVSYQAWGTIVP